MSVSLVPIFDASIKFVAEFVSKLLGHKSHTPPLAAVSQIEGSAVAIGDHNTQSVTIQQQNIFQTPAVSESKGSSPTAFDIQKELRAIPAPYLRKQAEGSYEGLKVRWLVTFETVEPDMQYNELERYDFCLFHMWSGNRTAGVCAYISVGHEPRLKTLYQGAKLWLEGEIDYASTDIVRLKPNPKIEYV
jgi:hypothetical protein